ncbi:MAG TPA: YigZ family protein [Pseudidiomarina sp.]|nr:YigZ family protein [Pseudidiomarina sp.]
MQKYWVPAQAAEAELVVKNSRFITSVVPVQSAADCKQHLLNCQTQWPGASHYCSAAIYGAPDASQTYAMSDDGEPSGTAGRPLLNVLLASQLGNISAIVVRYFGGVKLGTGGLQRAYTQALVDTLEVLPKAEKLIRNQAIIDYAYADQKAVQHLLERFDVTVAEQQFGERITLSLEVIAETQHSLASELKNATQGRVILQRKQQK